MFLLSTVPAVLLAVGMRLCPESPRWLISKERHSEAHDVMRRLWNGVDPSIRASDDAPGMFSLPYT